MVISASRRTDIPAFYGKWLLNRFADGNVEVVNPFNPAQVRRVDLRPEAVDAIVFWTRNARPFLKYLDRIDERGYNYYFLYTITGYPKELEPNLPPAESAIGTFRQLADRIGPKRVVWRYDPIVVSSLTDRDFHLRNFESLARRISGAAGRVIVSFLDFYRKTDRRLRELSERQGITWERLMSGNGDDLSFVGRMRQIAESYGLSMQSCAEEHDFMSQGIHPGQCVDFALINTLFGPGLTYRKDASQRSRCLCGSSVDIGAYNTCGFRCVYCYANASFDRSTRYLESHDPDMPSLSSSIKQVCSL